MINLPLEIKLIQPLIQPGEQIYLVGGAIRDAFLLKSGQDLDFVCAHDPRITGQKLAEKLSGAFFMLDEVRNACRVIANNELGEKRIFDFTKLRGQNIHEDLKVRDFTINAIAIDLFNQEEIIDPLHGKQDLADKRLRACTKVSFRDDPLRVMRAIRYSVKYDLKIEPWTLDELMRVVKDLSSVSNERKRDEFFKILEMDKPWLALDCFEKYGILSHVKLGKLPDPVQAINRLKFFIASADSMQKKNQEVNSIELAKISTLFSILSPDITRLCKRFNQVNQSERSILALDGLIALLWDLDEIEGEKTAKGLALSVDEQRQICVSLRNKRVIFEYFAIQKIPSRTFLYRYYQLLGAAGLDVAILSLTEAATNQSESWSEERWVDLVRFCHKVLETWFLNPEYINPKLILDGRDLMVEFDVPQGPRIGRFLEGLREAQAIGSIQDRTQALAWVDEQIQKGLIAD